MLVWIVSLSITLKTRHSAQKKSSIKALNGELHLRGVKSFIVMLALFMLSVILQNILILNAIVAECHYAEYSYT
jgi:hypothetical protein